MEPEKTVVAEQPQAPVETPEQQLAKLKEETVKLTNELEAARKGQATLSQSLKKREEALNQQAELRNELKALNERTTLLAAYISEAKGEPPTGFEEAQATRKPDLLKQFEELEAKRKADADKANQQAQLEQFTEVVSGYQKRVEALGLTENDETYWDIKGLVETSFNRPDNLRRAEIKIKKLEEAKNVAKPTETEEQRIDRLVEERLRKKMEETGMLKPEGGTPSVASSAFEKIEAGYVAGDIDYATYAKARKEQGL